MADQLYKNMATDSDSIRPNSDTHAEDDGAIATATDVQEISMSDAQGSEDEVSRDADQESDAEGTPEYEIPDAYDQLSAQHSPRATAIKTASKPLKQQLRRSARVKTLDAAKAKLKHDHAIARREEAVAQGLRRSGRLVGL